MKTGQWFASETVLNTEDVPDEMSDELVELAEIEAIYSETAPELRPRMLELLSDYAKSDFICEWARNLQAQTDPEYRLRRALREHLVDTLPTKPR